MFKFEIGDMVCSRQAVQESLDSIHLRKIERDVSSRFPLSMVIVERIEQECPGGIQRHYVCAINGQNSKHTEIELMTHAQAFAEVSKALAESTNGK